MSAVKWGQAPWGVFKWASEAINTADERMSLIGLGLAVPSVLPAPKGEFNLSDRAMLMWLYHRDLLLFAYSHKVTIELVKTLFTDDLTDSLTTIDITKTLFTMKY